jgi:tRNA(Arg) A34 adenosine deaminase TadA
MAGLLNGYINKIAQKAVFCYASLMNDKDFLMKAIELAEQSVEAGGFPAGAIVVKDGKIIGEGLSLGFKNNDPTGHAETVAIRDACKNLNTADLTGAILYESLQTCTMCFSVAYWAGISKIVSATVKTDEMVRKQYYEGSTKPEEINKQNNRQIELVIVSELEEAALEPVRQWEGQGNKF